jgi:F-type H+-transporting ATPase subunit alpha
MSIYAGTKGYVDDIPVAEARRFEADLLEYVHSREPGIPKEIVETGKLTEETASKLSAAIEDFKRGFEASGSPELAATPDRIRIGEEGKVESA